VQRSVDRVERRVAFRRVLLLPLRRQSLLDFEIAWCGNTRWPLASGRVEGRRHDDSLTSTRRTLAGQTERSRCRLDSLVRFLGPLYTVGWCGTRSDLQSSPCSSTLPSSLPFAKAKAKSNCTVTIGTNSETAASTRLERCSSEHEKSNVKRETLGA